MIYQLKILDPPGYIATVGSREKVEAFLRTVHPSSYMPERWPWSGTLNVFGFPRFKAHRSEISPFA